jgi:hypothetical protein
VLVGELRSIILLHNILLVIIQMHVSMQKRYRTGRDKIKQIVFQPRIVLQKPGERGKICIARPKAWALSLVLFVVCIIMQLVSVLVENVKQKRVRSSDLNPGNCVANYSSMDYYFVHMYRP